MLAFYLLLAVTAAGVIWLWTTGAGRNRTPDIAGQVRPLRPLDWFDVPHAAGRAGRRR